LSIFRILLEGYKRFNELRKKNPHLTTMVALGGWTEGSEKYSIMAKDPKLRANFVKSVVEFLKKHDFDGLDMDWEYPGQRGGDIEVDKKDFTLLLRELRAAFDPHGYILSAAVSPGKKVIDDAYEIKEIDALLDFYCIMAYDYHGGSWEKHIGHNAPLYPRPNDDKFEDTRFLNINFTMHYWLEKGASKDKVVMGLPLYGRTFSLKDGSLDRIPEWREEARYVDKKRLWGGPNGTIIDEAGNLPYVEVSIFKRKRKYS